MRFLAAVVLALALYIPAAAPAGDAQSTLTRREAVAMSPNQLKTQILRQLSQALIEDQRPASGRDQPLFNVRYWIRPAAAERASVCQASFVTFTLDPRPEVQDATFFGQGLGAGTPVSLTGVEASNVFLVLPPGREENAPGVWPRGLRAQCAKLDPRKAGFFAAAGAHEAAQAAWLLARVQAAADRPEPGFAVVCPGGVEGRCLGLLRGALTRVEACPKSPGRSCVRLRVGTYEGEVTATWVADGLRIDRVEVRELALL